MRQHSERLGKESISKLLVSLALPATIGMFVMAFYNVVDTIFVSRAVGTVGIAAVSIAFPVQMLVMAVAGAIGIGGASLISRMLGADRLDDANKVFGNILILVLIFSIIGVLFALSFLTPILYLFGSSETILPYAQEYLGVILYGTVFFAFGFCMNNIVRAEGNAKIAMYTMLISAGLNIILTPLFLFGFNMGIKGSALATVVSQAVMAIYLAFYFFIGKSSLSFKIVNLFPDISIIKRIMAIGSSAFVQQGSGSVMFIFANHALIAYGGDLGVAVFGIIHRVMMFSLMPVIGVVQGLMPLVGYNYGAGLYSRVRQSILLAFKVSTLIVIFAFSVIMFFPKIIMLIFTNDPDAISMGIIALRIMFALLFTVGIQIVTGGVFQALGRAKIALVLSTSRQILFLIPLILILPLFFDLNGVWMAFPIADFFAFMLSLLFIKTNKDIFIYRT